MDNLTVVVVRHSAARVWKFGPMNDPSCEFEIVIVGAGPAGLAAACAAAESGRRVAVLDDTPWVGGQIWRGAQSPPAVPMPRQTEEQFAERPGRNRTCNVKTGTKDGHY